MDKQELSDNLTKLLMETGKAHHQAFTKTDGVDPDWADWYGEYLNETFKLVRC